MAPNIIEFSSIPSVNSDDLIDDGEKLEEKLFKLLGCMQCHNIFFPIVELGNLYNRRGEYSIAKRLFDIVLQWKRDEPISNLGKAEGQLQSGWDIKSAEASLFDLDEIYEQITNTEPMLNNITQGFTRYDIHFIRAKIDYLRAIVSLRWDRKVKSKELLKSSLKNLQEKSTPKL